MKKTILLTISVLCLLIASGQNDTLTSNGRIIYGDGTKKFIVIGEAGGSYRKLLDISGTSITWLKDSTEPVKKVKLVRGRSPFTYSRCHCSTCGWYKGDKGKIDTTSIDPFRSYYIENLSEFYENEDSIGGIKTAFRGRHSLDSIYTEKFGGMVNKKVK